ncbi:MAG: PadR family transcriptional regulator, partial [Candidatus Latescibacterota bacterium]
LEKSGALSSRTEKVGNSPERKVYSITPEGRKTLSDMVVKAISAPPHADPAIPSLGIGFVYGADETAVLRAIENKIAALETDICHHVREDEEHKALIPLNWMLLLENAIARKDGEMNTLKKLKEAIESGGLTESIKRVIALTQS